MRASEALEAREGVQSRVSMPQGDAGRGHVETTEARGHESCSRSQHFRHGHGQYNATPKPHRAQGPGSIVGSDRGQGGWGMGVGGLPVGALDS